MHLDSVEETFAADVSEVDPHAKLVQALDVRPAEVGQPCGTRLDPGALDAPSREEVR